MLSQRLHLINPVNIVEISFLFFNSPMTGLVSIGQIKSKFFNAYLRRAGYATFLTVNINASPFHIQSEISTNCTSYRKTYAKKRTFGTFQPSNPTTPFPEWAENVRPLVYPTEGISPTVSFFFKWTAVSIPFTIYITLVSHLA